MTFGFRPTPPSLWVRLPQPMRDEDAHRLATLPRRRENSGEESLETHLCCLLSRAGVDIDEENPAWVVTSLIERGASLDLEGKTSIRFAAEC